MKHLLAILSALGVVACTTSSGATLDQIIRGPARVCLDRSAFTLPVEGAIVEARRGSLGSHLVGRIGPHAFEITESDRFAAAQGAGRSVFDNGSFVVRQIGDLPGSYAVYLGSGDSLQQQPAVRIEHLFGTDSITVEQFFGAFDPVGAARGPCDRTFRYSI